MAEGATMLDAVQDWDTSVRGTISKGRFVKGAQHPRIFGRGHIGWGHINSASILGPTHLTVQAYCTVYAH